MFGFQILYLKVHFSASLIPNIEHFNRTGDQTSLIPTC